MLGIQSRSPRYKTVLPHEHDSTNAEGGGGLATKTLSARCRYPVRYARNGERAKRSCQEVSNAVDRHARRVKRPKETI